MDAGDSVKGYPYAVHAAPHDIQVRELGSGRSRRDTAKALGIDFQIVAQTPLEDGIHAARMILPRCYFDAEKCRVGLEALSHYRREYQDRLQTFRPTPLHDRASHGADAFRGLAIRHRQPKEPMPEGDRLARLEHRWQDRYAWMS